jgi:uncharacterized protein (TIGR02001 family)
MEQFGMDSIMKKISFGVGLVYLSLSMHCFAENPEEAGPVKVDSSKTKYVDFVGNFDLTSNYIFRGTSASNNLPAVQGGFTFTFLKPGIYLNLWGSSTSFANTTYNENATVEIDTIVGIRNSITKNLSYDISYAQYIYPKANHAQFGELIPKISYTIGLLTITPNMAYTANIFSTHKPATYYNGRLDLALPSKYVYFNDLTASGSVGHWSLPKSVGLNSYNDYMLGISKTIKNYVLSLQWTDTNGMLFNNSLDDPHIFATVLVNF